MPGVHVLLCKVVARPFAIPTLKLLHLLDERLSLFAKLSLFALGLGRWNEFVQCLNSCEVLDDKL